jgi:hypothetical protein
MQNPPSFAPRDLRSALMVQVFSTAAPRKIGGFCTSYRDFRAEGKTQLG